MKRLLAFLGVVVLFGFTSLSTRALAGDGIRKQPQHALPQPPSFNQETQSSSSIDSPFFVSPSDSLDLPTAILQTENQVSFKDIQQIAIRNARSLWGKVAQGPVIPYCDRDGKISTYVFTFRIGDDPFPPYNIALKENEFTTKGGKSQYSTILVSASSDAIPIREYCYGLPPFYLKGLQTLLVARQLLSTNNLSLRHIYCFGTPLDLWFDFQGSSEDKRIVVDPYRHRTKTSQEFQNYIKSLPRKNAVLNTKEIQRIKSEWKSFLNGKTLSFLSDHYVPNYTVIPFFDWEFGCSPTSGSMLLEYYEGRYVNFGLLVSLYYQRNCPDPNEGVNYHVADAQRYLAYFMGTDTTWYSSGYGGTDEVNIGSGIASYSRFCYYNFTTSSVYGSSSNNWAWSDITSEINAGRPFVWSVWGDSEAHSLCGVGYADNYPSVIVHNTWTQYLDWWWYDSYRNREPAMQTHVVKVQYGNPLTQEVVLTSPIGGQGYGNQNGNGENWLANSTHWITWQNWGNSNGTVNVYYSTNGGNNWIVIATSQPNSGQYSWHIPNGLSTTQARVLIELTVGSQFEASDGSYGNFTISTSGVEENSSTNLPTSFKLGTWSPNPFSSSSDLSFDLPAPARLSGKLYDVTGREVMAIGNRVFSQGHHNLKWDGKDGSGKSLPSGVYFSRIEIGSQASTQKLIINR